LHENERAIELVDSKLSTYSEEQVKIVIGVGLLCSQASPTLRPSMSRVVAMLSGDAEVNTVTSRPGYLTDWKFDDVTSSFMCDIQTEEMVDGDTTPYNFTPSTSTLVNPDAEHSPRPMLQHTNRDEN
jgi:hypothetical protein